MLFMNSEGLDFEKIILVSSANKTGWAISVTIFSTLFIWRRKNKGPWGTSCLTFTQSEEILL